MQFPDFSVYCLFFACKGTIRGKGGLGNHGRLVEIGANKGTYGQMEEKESMKKSANSISGNGRTICTRIISRETDETEESIGFLRTAPGSRV